MPRGASVSLALLALATLLAAATAFSPGAAAQGVGEVPDLTVTIRASAPNLELRTVVVTHTTTNGGLAPARESKTRLFLVPVNTPLDLASAMESAIDIRDQEIPALAPSGVHAATTEFMLGAGSFQIIAWADAGEVVAEADEDNNLNATARDLTIGPDLQVRGLSVSGGGTTAEDITRNRARNNTKVGASTTLFYLSADGQLDAGDTPIGSRAIPELDARTVSVGTTQLTTPPGLGAGTYRVIAVADADNVHAESDETNNLQISSPIVFSPDLIISSITVPRKTAAGETISVTDTTTNRGTAWAPASRTGLYFSRDRVLDVGDLLLGSRAIPPLDAGATSSLDTTLVIPDNTPPGCYFVIASADIEQAVEESREANTARARPIQVRPASGAKLLCAPGDFNGDRKSDVLWRHSSGLVAIWQMFTFSLSNAAIDASMPLDWTARLGDFNGDGKADILWRHASGPVFIWLMDGTQITGAGVLPDPSLDWTVQGIGDFNGDGKADILWRQASGPVVIWLMDGTQIIGDDLLPDPSLDWTVQGIGDFNGDGKADILWRQASGLVAIWLMDGASVVGGGSFAGPPSDWTIQGTADFNGDSKADILWRHAQGLVVIWLMDGSHIMDSGLIAPPSGVLPGGSLSWTILATGDFDGDGKADILWRDASGPVGIWLMDGTTISSSPSIVADTSLDWTLAGVGDFDGDGTADIFRRHSSGRLEIWLVDSSGISAPLFPGASLDSTIQGTGDFNSDGIADIVWRDASGLVSIWLMDGPSDPRPGVVVTGRSPIWRIQGIGDFNGDGRADILWWDPLSGSVEVSLMNGTTIIGTRILGGPSRSRSVRSGPVLEWTVEGVGDFNGDGTSDILWRHASGSLAIWFVESLGISSVPISTIASLDWTIQGIGDFNRDHKTDILWRDASGLLAIWLMDGTSVIGNDTFPGPSLDWTIEALGDFNGDVNADILWRHDSGFVVIWLMDGTGISEEHQLGGVPLDWAVQ